MGLFSNKNKRDRAAEDSGRFYSKDDDAAIGERARSKRASHAGATANSPNASGSANSGAGARRSAADPLLPEKKRARRRLVGAIALALAAAVGLPMLLDSAPKPLAGDIAIQIPAKDKAAPLPAPGTPADGAAANDADATPAVADDRSNKPGAKPADGAVDKKVADKPAAKNAASSPAARPKSIAAADSVDQGEEVIAAPPPKPAVHRPETKPETRPESRHVADLPKPEHKDTHAADKAREAAHEAEKAREAERAREAKEAREAERAREAKEADRLARARDKAAAEDHPKAVPDKPKHDDAARAMAILEGKGAGKADNKADNKSFDAPAPASSAKSTIQVAAMSSQDKAAELQARLSAAGISSYTEKSASGLVRVKVGPLAKDDADKVRAKLGKLGL